MPKLSTTETIGVIGSVFSILSVILYGIDKLFTADDNLVVLGFFISLISIAIFFVFFGIRLHIGYKNLNKINLSNLKETYKSFHQITHNFRDSIWEIQRLQQEFDNRISASTTKVSLENLRDYMYEKSSSIFNGFADSITGTIVDILKKFFMADGINENFRVTIKTLKPENDKDARDWSVTTACRDPIANRNIDKDYSEKPCFIRDNTDFYEIVYAEKRVFASNDLLDLSRKNSYRNSSTNWHIRYNSTIVLPIRYKLKVKNNSSTINKLKDNVQTSNIIYGFLAVDSMNDNKKSLFSDDLNSPIVNLVAHTADLLAIWFRYWELLCETSSLKITTLQKALDKDR